MTSGRTHLYKLLAQRGYVFFMTNNTSVQILNKNFETYSLSYRILHLKFLHMLVH